MASTDYKYQIKERAGKKCIIIEDKCLGGVPVESDIQKILVEISAKERIDPKECLVVFRDRNGDWDGWNAELGVFVALYMRDWIAAVDFFRRRSMVLVE